MGALGGGDQDRRVAGAAAGDHDRDLAAGDPLDRLDHLVDREAAAVAQVADQVLARLRRVQGQQVRVGQVRDVDVVADAGAVRGRVVVAVDRDVLALPERGLEDQRDQVRLRVVPLAERDPGRTAVRARDVEVAQRDGGQAVGDGLAGDQVVHGQLGGAVGVGGRGAGGLGDRDRLRLAVGGGGGGEHQLAHARRAHRGDQLQRAGHVVAPVLLRVHDRLADLGGGREVQHAVEGAVQDLAGLLDPSLDELGTGRHALPEPGREVVQDGHPVPRLQQVGGDHTADIAGATRDQVLTHDATSLRSCRPSRGLPQSVGHPGKSSKHN